MTSSVLPNYLDRLNDDRKRLENFSIADLFEANSDRFDDFSVNFENILFDFSKNRLDEQALKSLLELCSSAKLQQRRDDMFSGEAINETENRAVLHTALRNRTNKPVMVNGVNVMDDVNAELARMADFSGRVRDGRYQVSGGQVTDVVNIGIGGSDLGPRMVTQALATYESGPTMHFVSNIDGADISDILKNLNPETTLFILASKTFTTQETMINAATALNWMSKAVGAQATLHFCALSTNLEATREFGIPDDRTFGFWDWVGGRYSVWSAIGLSVMISLGESLFNEFLDGAHAIDQHFQQAPFSKNIPVLLALIGIWHRNVWKMPAQAVLAYDNRLARFDAWMQQLDMESNGKAIMMSGEACNFDTGPIIFGEAGANGQHAFYQLIHQGSTVIPCDFLIAAQPNGTELASEDHHRLLVANCFAQSEALMVGRSLQQAGGDLHKVFSGNRPSNTILFKSLDPRTLGSLMAIYEHKVFVQGVLWGINSFDQWGVELGKELAKSIDPILKSGNVEIARNASTRGLIKAALKF